ncbi:MAG: hypothetical protein GF364_13525 [Candidatus Lokiarchaeota archaeon]|nr:hypothetical protein [Candidatus Lokiarchaeota archaeon]
MNNIDQTIKFVLEIFKQSNKELTMHEIKDLLQKMECTITEEELVLILLNLEKQNVVSKELRDQRFYYTHLGRPSSIGALQSASSDPTMVDEDTKDRIEDDVFLLYILYKRPNNKLSVKKLMLLLFLSKYWGFKQGLQVLYADFYKTHYGITAPKLYAAIEDLHRFGLVEIEDTLGKQGIICLNDKGIWFIEEISDIFEGDYKHISKIYQETLTNYGEYNPHSLVNTIMDLELDGYFINLYEDGSKIIFPDRYKEKVLFDSAWVETIHLAMDPGFVEQMDKIIVESSKDKPTRFIPLK